jgi:type 2 lantibiotic biosynthesis protein LanM
MTDMPGGATPARPETADWYQALSLVERLGGPSHGPSKPRTDTITESARKRLARWKSQPPFATTSLFAERLAIDAIAEEDLLGLLSEPPEALRRRLPPPPWAARVERAFSDSASQEPIAWPEEIRPAEMLGFLQSVEPLVHAAVRELRDGIRRLAGGAAELPFDPATAWSLFLPHLPQRLLSRLARALVLDLNVARVQGLLGGGTAEERFESFLAKIRRPGEMLALLREYPVLAREVVRCLDQWVAANLEFLERLAADWAAIRQNFIPDGDPGPLVEAKGDAGDRHRQGRSVFLLRFTSGFRLVYKPKSLAVDVHCGQLLDWIDRQGSLTAGSGTSPVPQLRIPRVLDRGRYGWAEFVEARTCQRPEEVGLFYRRQGAFLALFYALAAIDFHHENLIADGAHPVPLDLEALFHPLGLQGDNKRADYLASVMLFNSVFGVGLLPGRIWSNPEFEGVDMSGLGGLPGQLFPFASPAWEGEGTDEMRLIRKRYPMPEAANRPTLQGQPLGRFEHGEELVGGFRDMYRFLESHREQLLGPHGPLDWFAGDEVRVVIRATRTYSELLHESFHPDVLRNGLDRDRLFDRLWNGADSNPHLARLIPAERFDLWNGDVPMFTTVPPSRDLWTSTGERVGGVLDEPGMSRARRRLEAMGDDDLARQVWFIRASLATLAPVRPRPPKPVYQLHEAPARAGRPEFLAAARAVADRLEKLAIHGEDDVSWVGLAAVQERAWSLVPLGTDLYDGLPGVAFFLAYIGSVTEDERYTRLARAALQTLRHSLRFRPDGVSSIGAFAGWGGLLYAWTHLGVLWGDGELIAETEAFVERLGGLIEKDGGLDVIDGSAGCVLTLLRLERCLPCPQKALDAAVRCGHRLIARAQPAGQGVGWMTRVPSKVPLAGLSHGAAGMAWALLSLAARTGERHFEQCARQAIAYERGLFSAERRKWPDLRDFPGEPAGAGRFECMTAWCHGGAGIGLARLTCLPYVDDPAVRGEIDVALETTRAEGFGWNHSLCHGDLGNLELLAQAGRVLGDVHWHGEAERVGDAILETIDRDGWVCANPVGVESPGLMTGLAGIGHGLLRLAEPDRVPSVLILEPPPGPCPQTTVACGY